MIKHNFISKLGTYFKTSLSFPYCRMKIDTCPTIYYKCKDFVQENVGNDRFFLHFIQYDLQGQQVVEIQFMNHDDAYFILHTYNK